jgi:hypothetical protein
MVTDAQLIQFLGLADVEPADAARLIKRLRPEQRRAYEHMFEVQQQLNAGIMPKGVLVDFAREKRRRRR